LVHGLDTFNEQRHVAQQHVPASIRRLYADLKAYRISPTSGRRRTGFVMLDRLMARLHANKTELLAVLDHPAIPLHANGAERDIRCHVTKRKISGGTRSDVGRDCRDVSRSGRGRRQLGDRVVGLSRQPARHSRSSSRSAAARSHRLSRPARLAAPARGFAAVADSSPKSLS
jgi:hypothetical protein